MPRGVGIDLRSVGAVEMHRISEVVLNEGSQQFRVEFKDERFTNPVDTITNQPVEFEDYETAVATEIGIYNTKVKESNKKNLTT